jgi:hypothetical protein
MPNRIAASKKSTRVYHAFLEVYRSLESVSKPRFCGSGRNLSRQSREPRHKKLQRQRALAPEARKEPVLKQLLRNKGQTSSFRVTPYSEIIHLPGKRPSRKLTPCPHFFRLTFTLLCLIVIERAVVIAQQPDAAAPGLSSTPLPATPFRISLMMSLPPAIPFIFALLASFSSLTPVSSPGYDRFPGGGGGGWGRAANPSGYNHFAEKGLDCTQSVPSISPCPSGTQRALGEINTARQLARMCIGIESCFSPHTDEPRTRSRA